MNDPLVSIVMPVYNAEPYLRLTLDSMLAQTMQDFEFIAIDDGSTDASLSILRRCADREPRLRVYSRENRGIVATLNEGIGYARGRYIARIDADDLSEPRRLELQIARMESAPELVVLGSNSVVTDPSGRRLGTFPVPLEHDEIDAAHLRGYSSIHHPSAMIRTDAIRRIGGYREGLCPAEDLDLWIRLAEIGVVGNLSHSLLIRRLTLSGLVATKEHLQSQTIAKILEDTWGRRQLPGKPIAPARRALSLGERYRQWAWLAINDGQPATARRYAACAFVREPLHAYSWRTLFWSLLAG